MTNLNTENIHVFQSEMSPKTPAQVIMHLLDKSIREDKFGVAGQQTLWFHSDVLKEMDEYIERLIHG